MEFGKYLGKGLWGLADKALPVVYGLGYVLLVIRVLPEEEFGNFVLVQEIFLIISGLATAFALQPLLKFAAEDSPDLADTVGAGFLLNVAFTLTASVAVAICADPISRLLNSPGLYLLVLLVPAMLAASLLRNFALIVLQARFQIKQVFWIDAAHFLGAPFFTWVVSRMHMFDSAYDLVIINIISLSLSSVVGLICARPFLHLTLKPGMTAVRKVSNYGRYTLGGIVSYLFYSKSDSFILSAFSGPAQVAVYNSAKVFVRVYEMVTQVVQMFVLPAVSRLSWQGELKSVKVVVEKALLFSTIGMLPVFVLFLFFPSVLVQTLYAGRYPEAILLLRIFAFLSLVAPLLAIGSNMLLGLGHAKENFLLGLQTLGVSTGLYLLLTPVMMANGAALAYVLSSFIMAVITFLAIKKHVKLTLRGVLGRYGDIMAFLKARFLRSVRSESGAGQ